jgi:hypothetical protein
MASANVTLYVAEPNRSLTVADGTHAGTSNTFTVSPALLDHLTFAQQPGGSPTGGVAFPTQPSVMAADVYGNGVSGANVALTIKPLTGTGGAKLSCPSAALNTLATISSGAASFTDCAIDKAGTAYQVRATAGSTVKDSGPFDVIVGPAAKLAFTTQPSSPANHGTAFAQQPVVSVEDAGGNVVNGDNTTVVSLGLAGGAPGAKLTCTTVPAHVSNGVATFGGCSIDLASATPYQVTASGNSSTTTGPFPSTDVVIT